MLINLIQRLNRYTYFIFIIINFIIEKNKLDAIIESPIKNHTVYPIDYEATPLERNSHSLSSDTNNKLFYIFGGGYNKGLLNDLWSFDLSTHKWKQIMYTGAKIFSREMHGSVYVELFVEDKNKLETKEVNDNKKSKFLLIFGGRSYEEPLDDIFSINLETNFSEKIGRLPRNMCSFSYININNHLIIYGGTDVNEFINDIYIYDIIKKR